MAQGQTSATAVDSPDTLPADFFDKKKQGSTAPDILPGNFFETKATAAQPKPTGSFNDDALRGATQATGIGATPSKGFFEKATNYLNNVTGDVKHGTDATFFGKALKSMGAPGTESGVSEGTSDYMASPVLGPVKAATGATEIAQPGKRWQGTKDFFNGAVQAAQIPTSFMAPEAAGGAASKVAEMTPGAKIARAGAGFQDVMAAAKNHPVEVTDSLSKSLSEYAKLVDAGGSRSVSVHKLLQRLTSPEKGPLTYEEARDFGSNISRLSADEQQRLTPVMKRAVGQIAAELRNATEATASRAGKLEQFQKAMKDYSSGMKGKEFLEKAMEVIKSDLAKGIGYGVGGAAGGYAASKLMK